MSLTLNLISEDGWPVVFVRYLGFDGWAGDSYTVQRVRPSLGVLYGRCVFRRARMYNPLV